jgi:hypothetical protein
MEVESIDTNMYCNKNITETVENIFSNGCEYEEDLYDHDDDAFSDVDYDSDDCEASLMKRRYDEDDSEDDIWEDDEEDEEISEAIRLQLLREKSKKQLDGLCVLEGKLNWLEKVPIVESDLDNDDYPVLGAIVKPSHKDKNTSPGSMKYVPATCIKVKVGKRTYIEFEPVYCKTVKDGKKCLFGEKCNFSHDMPKPEIDYSTRLCNFIRNGEDCKFKERCKFSHDITILKKRKPSNERKTERGPKPMCRNGLKCENRKCTFTHPPGHNKSKFPPIPRTQYFSPKRSSPRSSPKRSPQSSPKHVPVPIDKKFLLCKNIFKIEGETIIIIGKCRFGAECKFAHSRVEVEQKIKENLKDFECKHKICKGVDTEFITKKDKDGKDRKTRRYKNNATRKCFKIHEKERITDFIIRTQGSRM